MNRSHQQSPKENIESKCKKHKKHTLVAQEMELCRNFQQNKRLKKMNSRRRGTIGKGGEISEFYLLFFSPIGLYKEKKKSQK